MKIIKRKVVRLSDLEALKYIVLDLYWSEYNSAHYTDHRLTQLAEGLEAIIEGNPPWFCRQCLGKDESRHDD